jgi:hypothetical protein
MRRILLLLLLVAASAGAQQERAALRFEIPVLPQVERHLDLLTTPGFAALALENNGLYASVSSRLVIRSREHFQVQSASVRYAGRKGPVYLYTAGATLLLGLGESTFTFDAELDTTDVAKGKVIIRLYSPLARALPRDLVDRIQFKIRSLANLQSQRKLLDYLDRLALENPGKPERVLEAIALEAYNNRAGSLRRGQGNETWEGSAFSDSIVLLLLATLWLVGYPIFLLFFRRRERRRLAERA